jgi:hypothetical protein
VAGEVALSRKGVGLCVCGGGGYQFPEPADVYWRIWSAAI